MRSIAFADFLIGVGILFVLEGLMFAASPAWMRRAMKSALATPDNILRAVGIGSAVVGLILIWVVRRSWWYKGFVMPGTSPSLTDEFGTRAVQQNRERPGTGFSPKCPAQMLAPIPRSGALWPLI